MHELLANLHQRLLSMRSAHFIALLICLGIAPVPLCPLPPPLSVPTHLLFCCFFSLELTQYQLIILYLFYDSLVPSTHA